MGQSTHCQLVLSWKLIELNNYYFLHKDKSRKGYNVWSQSLLQVIGFPILLPFFLLVIFSSKKRKLLLITTHEISRAQLAIWYPIIATYLFTQASLSNSSHNITFTVFTLIYTTQLIFTPIFSLYFNKTKLNRWIIISLIFATLTGAFTLYTFSSKSPIYDPRKKHNYRGMWVALCASIFLSLLLCNIRIVFEELISSCNEYSINKIQPNFAIVLELLIFSSLLTTIAFVATVFISGEHHNLKREMSGFLKGESAFLRTIIGQAVAWQVYWVGIVGLVFSVSAVFSNVISVCAWPVVSLLVVCFYKEYGDYDVLRGTALATAALSLVSYFYCIHKEKTYGDSEGHEAST